MENELDVIDSLQALRYEGTCLQNDALTAALDGGIRSIEFRQLVQWLTHELHVLRKTDEHISKDVEDANEFAMELSSLLKELGCPFQLFVTGPLSERFESRQMLLQLLDYLITELMSTKMSLKLRPAEQSYIIPKVETNTARSLENLTRDLQLGKPPENITPKALFDKLNFRLDERLRQANRAVVNEPLLKTTKPLSNVQWKKLDAIHSDLDAEYNLRRQVLLTRLEVTIQSFQWSESMKSRENEIVERFQGKMKELERLKYGGDETNVVALLSARADLAIIEKTSSANVRKNTASKIQKHVIGSVPDRGGRANEHAPPPPEMPSWQQQRASGPQAGGRGGGGSGGGRGGGGYIRGGRGGGGGGSGGQTWQQPAQNQQPQFQQQRSQFEQSNDWVAGSGRVQGQGWNNQGADSRDSHDRGDGGYNKRGGGGGGGGYNRGGGGGGRGGYNQQRGGGGVYNRGGGGAGRGGFNNQHRGGGGQRR